MILAISRATMVSTISGRRWSSQSLSIGRSISRTALARAVSARGGQLALFRLAERGERSELLAGGGGRVVGRKAVRFGDRVAKLENVFFHRRLLRLTIRAVGARRTRGRAGVVGDHPFDGSEDLLHRRITVNIPHNEGLIAYSVGGVTGVFSGGP